MKTYYANQKSITINRELPQKGSCKKFLTVYYDNITLASRTLSGEVAFKLYLYLLSNADKYTDEFSPQCCANEFGISVDRCRKAFHQLEEEGYIVQTDKNEYQFYEKPQKKSTFVSKMKVEYRMLETDTGFRKLDYNTFYNEAKAEGMTDKDINITWEASEIAED